MPVDMFMKMNGEKQGEIKGESRDKKHKGEIDVMSFGADGVPGGEGKNADIGSWQ